MNHGPRWHGRDIAITLGAFLLLVAWDASGADLWLERFYGGAQGFPLREHWFTARVLHDGGRLLAGAVVAALVLNIWRPWTPRLPRAGRVAWLAVTVVGLAMIPLLKKNSLTSCPWDLDEFGGVAHWVSHWTFGAADGGAGHCFPSGHATAAVAFFGGWFALREPHPRLARAWLAGVLVLGLLFGWGQLARGAHFASHTLWSAWLCWTLGLLALGYRRSWPATTTVVSVGGSRSLRVVPSTKRRRST